MGETVTEIKDFFKNASQAQSFLEWLEKCKMRFLAGEAPAAPPAKPVAAKHVAKAAHATPKAAARAPAQPATVRSSTKRALSLTTEARSKAKVSKTAAPRSEKRKKNELLESMTKNLQQILTKLGDPTLQDDMREKYQNLAQNIKMQMAKISQPQATTKQT